SGAARSGRSARLTRWRAERLLPHAREIRQLRERRPVGVRRRLEDWPSLLLRRCARRKPGDDRERDCSRSHTPRDYHGAMLMRPSIAGDTVPRAATYFSSAVTTSSPDCASTSTLWPGNIA